jgi:hypothetical protein
MRVHEIVTERREQVDEALPLLVLPVLGSVSIGALISTVLAAWSVSDIIRLLSKAGKDPQSMTDSDWVELFINLVLTLPALRLVPAFVKDKLPKLIPDSWKKKGAEKVKDVVTKGSGKSSGKLGTAAAVAGGAAAGAGGTAAVNKLSAPTSSQSSASSTQPSTLGGTTFGADTDKGDKFSRWFGRTQ